MLLKKLNTKIKEYTLKDSTFLYPLEIEVCTFRPNVVADGELRSSVAPTRVRSGKVRAGPPRRVRYHLVEFGIRNSEVNLCS